MAVYPLHLHLLRVQHQESRTTPAKVNWAPLDEGSVSIKSSLSERLGFRRNQRQRHSRGPTRKKSQSSGQEYWTWKSDFFHPSFSNGFRSSLQPQIVCKTRAAARTSFSERFLWRKVKPYTAWLQEQGILNLYPLTQWFSTFLIHSPLIQFYMS